MSEVSSGLRTALLQRIPLFSSLPQGALAALAARLEQRSIPAGTVLFREGEPGEILFIIEEGQIAILKKQPFKLLPNVVEHVVLVVKLAMVPPSRSTGTPEVEKMSTNM